MLIEVKNVSQPEKVGKYSEFDCVYITGDGKLNTRKIRSFVNQEVFDTLQSSSKGDKFDIKVEKDGKYWNWVGIEKTEASVSGAPAKSGGQRVTGSNYETPDEREWRQTRIIRQSCLNMALELLKAKNIEDPTQNDVFSTAAIFEQWVNRKEPIQAIKEMPDDIVQ